MLIRPRLDSLVVRSLPWPEVAVVLALATAPTLLVAVRHGRSPDDALLFWMVVAGAVFGFAFDEPARAVLDAVATPLARRTIARLAVLAVAIGVSGLAVVLVVRIDGGSLTPARAQAPALLAVIALSCAAASVGRRRGADRVSLGEAAVGPMAVLVASGLAQRYPWLPTIIDDRLAHRWLIPALAAFALAAWNTRDPYSPPSRSRSDL
ncbi:MAG: hypothetical protein IPM43_09945 [Actinomycetota bacterium]|nr:MAG: hypothetical protein IPM43_09945 [Actinomycetota bacterium]